MKIKIFYAEIRYIVICYNSASVGFQKKELIMAGGPEAWPEPEERPQLVVAPNFSWKGVFTDLEVIVETGDQLRVFGDMAALQAFADFFDSSLRLSIEASPIVSYDSLTIPSHFAQWVQTAPETWRYPGGVIIFYSPNMRELHVLASHKDVVRSLELAGAMRLEV